MTKKIGIIGFGEMGKRHGLEFREATKGNIEICGVVEPDDVMYQRGCEWNDLPDIPRFDTVADLLKHACPDGVIISSPNFTHLDNLIKLENAAIPIMLEKPLDTSLEKIAEIVRFARRYPAPVLVDHVMRHAPIIRKARELIEQGKLGRICSFEFTQRIGISMFHTFRRTQAGGGGHMIEKATHDLDVMLYLTGAKPLSVSMISAQHVVGGDKPNDLTCLDCPDAVECPYANLGRKTEVGKVKDITTLNKLCVFAKEVDVPDDEACLIRLSNGIFGTYSHTYFCTMPGHSRLYEVIGDKGALFITLSKEERYLGEVKYYPFDGKGMLETTTFEYFNKIHYNGGPYVARHFLDLMCGKTKTPFTTVEQAFTAEALGFAAMKSSAEKSRFVEIDEIIPEDMRSAIQGE